MFAASGHRSPWAEVHSKACEVAPIIRAAAGDDDGAIAILGGNTPQVIILIRAALLAGVPLTMLQPPGRAESTDQYKRRLMRQVTETRASLTLIEDEALAFLGDLAPEFAVEAIGSFLTSTSSYPGRNPHDPSEESVAFRHVTSGSTGHPRVVELSHAIVAEHMDNLSAASHHLDNHDVMVSWLPLYHDMGLFGFLLLPMTCGSCELVLGDPRRFLLRPASWLEDLSSYQATATAAPNFAYGLVSRHQGSIDSSISLDSLRFCLNGGERITESAVTSFVSAYSSAGLNPRSMIAAYGLAEATLAVTLGEVGAGIHFDTRVQTNASTGGTSIMQCALLGSPIPGVELRICDASGGPLAAEAAGSIEIRSASLSPSVSLRNGWFSTGDVGYVKQDQLVVCGRQKEVIIRGGQNYFPEDIELAALTTSGARAGAVAALRLEASDGSDELIVVVEAAGSAKEHDRIRRATRAAVLSGTGIAPRDVYVVPPGRIPKTPSGKMQRVRLANMLLSQGGSL